MARRILSALTIAAISSIAGSALADSSVDSVIAKLSATPTADEAGFCVRIVVEGTITVTGQIDSENQVQIAYQFLRSDLAASPIRYYMITEPGTQTVSDTSWRFMAQYLPFSGWVQLKAWPTRHEGGFEYAFSDQAQFTARCNE